MTASLEGTLYNTSWSFGKANDFICPLIIQIVQQIWVSLYTEETITLAFQVIRVFLSSTWYLGVLQIEC